MFGSLGGQELFLIFLIALIVFGPRKLPEIGKSLGKMMSEFRKASADFRHTVETEVEAEKIKGLVTESTRLDDSPAPAPATAESAAPAADSPSVAGGETVSRTTDTTRSESAGS
jgi:Tat protein translocase TatB subunit